MQGRTPFNILLTLPLFHPSLKYFTKKGTQILIYFEYSYSISVFDTTELYLHYSNDEKRKFHTFIQLSSNLIFHNNKIAISTLKLHYPFPNDLCKS